MTDRISPEPFLPGEYIQDFMEGKGWTREGLALALKLTRSEVDALLAGELAITPEIADRLGVAFGTSAKLWASLQRSCEQAIEAQQNRKG